MTPEQLDRVKQLEWAVDNERLRIALQIITKIRPPSEEEEKALIAARDALSTVLRLMASRP